MHRIKIVGHCVPPRNAITRVMLSLGQGRGIRREGGANLFSATCIPVDAPSALLYFLVGCAQGAQVEQVQRRSDGTLGRDDAH